MNRGRLRFAAITLLAACTARAQNLEPRAYSISPVGTNIISVAYSLSHGEVLFDPSLPVEDVTATLNGAGLGYYRAISVFGRSAGVRVGVPYTWGHINGLVAGEAAGLRRSGLADPQMQFSINLHGAPAMNRREFGEYRGRTNLAASLAVVAPLGQYDPAKLINISTNRWAFKPEIAVTRTIRRRWTAEAYAGVWLYTNNTDYFGGHVREQRPIATYQAHLSYTIRPGLWIAADATFYHGGRTQLDGRVNDDVLSSSRGGITLSVPLRPQHSLKFTYGNPAISRIGTRFRSIQVVYVFLWFD